MGSGASKPTAISQQTEESLSGSPAGQGTASSIPSSSASASESELEAQLEEDYENDAHAYEDTHEDYAGNTSQESAKTSSSKFLSSTSLGTDEGLAALRQAALKSAVEKRRRAATQQTIAPGEGSEVRADMGKARESTDGETTVNARHKPSLPSRLSTVEHDSTADNSPFAVGDAFEDDMQMEDVSSRSTDSLMTSPSSSRISLEQSVRHMGSSVPIIDGDVALTQDLSPHTVAYTGNNANGPSEIEEGEVTSSEYEGNLSDHSNMGSARHSSSAYRLTASLSSEGSVSSGGDVVGEPNFSQREQESREEQDYLNILHDLLSWGVQPTTLITVGVSIFDIRRILLPYYRPTSLSSRPIEPLAVPLPPAETAAASNRLMIHSQYKPSSAAAPAVERSDLSGSAVSLSRSVTPSLPAMQRPLASLPLRSQQSTVMQPKGIPGKQRNWDRPAETAVVLRYESRSPSPQAVAQIGQEILQDAMRIGEGDSVADNPGEERPSPGFPSSSESVPKIARDLSTQLGSSKEVTSYTQAQTSRQAALESLRARKSAALAGPGPSSSSNRSLALDANCVVYAATDPLQQAIADEVAKLEREMWSNVAPINVVPVTGPPARIDDGPEEGEIVALESDIPETHQVSLEGSSVLPSSSTTHRGTAHRGIKRPVASDFESQPTSTFADDGLKRTRKRTLFGGAAKRAAQLVIELSDSSDSSDSDTPEPQSTAGSEVETNRILLANKVEEIRLAKERLMAAIRKKEASKRASLALARSREAQISAEMSKSRASSQLHKTELEVVQPVTSPVTTLISTPPSGKDTVIQALEGEQRLLGSPVLDVTTGFDSNEHSNAESDRKGTASKVTDTQSLSRSESVTATGVSPPRPTHFTPYRSLLAQDIQSINYTVVLSRPGQMPGCEIETHASRQCIQRGGTFGFNEHMLSSIALTRILQADPAVRVCPYELGGGVCSDPSCSGLHLSRDVTVTDSDLSSYLLRSLRRPVPSAAQINFAMQEARRNQSTTLEANLLPYNSAIEGLLFDVVTILGLAT